MKLKYIFPVIGVICVLLCCLLWVRKANQNTTTDTETDDVDTKTGIDTTKPAVPFKLYKSATYTPNLTAIPAAPPTSLPLLSFSPPLSPPPSPPPPPPQSSPLLSPPTSSKEDKEMLEQLQQLVSDEENDRALRREQLAKVINLRNQIDKNLSDLNFITEQKRLVYLAELQKYKNLCESFDKNVKAFEETVLKESLQRIANIELINKDKAAKENTHNEELKKIQKELQDFDLKITKDRTEYENAVKAYQEKSKEIQDDCIRQTRHYEQMNEEFEQHAKEIEIQYTSKKEKYNGKLAKFNEELNELEKQSVDESILEAKRNDINIYLGKLKKLEEDLTAQKEEHQKKVDNLKQEEQNINKDLANRTSLAETAKRDLAKKEKELNDEEAKIETRTNELRQKEKDFSKTISDLKKAIEKLELENASELSKLNKLTADQNTLLETQKQNVEKLAKEVKDLEDKTQKAENDYKINTDLLQSKIDELQKNIDKTKEEIAKIDKEITANKQEYKKAIDDKETELQKLKDDHDINIKAKILEIDNLKLQHIDELKGKDEEKKNLEQEHNKALGEKNEELEKAKKDHNAKMLEKQGEIERITKENADALNEKTSELEKLQTKHKQAIDLNNSLIQSVEEARIALQNTIDNNKDELSRLQSEKTAYLERKDELGKNIDDAKKDIQTLQKSLQEAKNTTSNLKNDINEAGKVISSQRLSLNTLNRTNSELTKSLDLAKTTKSNLDKDIETIANTFNTAKESKQNLTDTLDKLRSEISTLETSLEDAEDAKSSIENEIKSLEKLFKENSDKKLNLTNNNEDIKNDISELSALLTNANKQIQDLKKEIKGANNEVDSLTQEKEDRVEKIKALKDTNASLVNEQNGTEKSNIELEKQLKQLKEKQDELKRQIEAAAAPPPQIAPNPISQIAPNPISQPAPVVPNPISQPVPIAPPPPQLPAVPLPQLPIAPPPQLPAAPPPQLPIAPPPQLPAAPPPPSPPPPRSQTPVHNFEIKPQTLYPKLPDAMTNPKLDEFLMELHPNVNTNDFNQKKWRKVRETFKENSNIFRLTNQVNKINVDIEKWGKMTDDNFHQILSYIVRKSNAKVTMSGLLGKINETCQNPNALATLWEHQYFLETVISCCIYTSILTSKVDRESYPFIIKALENFKPVISDDYKMKACNDILLFIRSLLAPQVFRISEWPVPKNFDEVYQYINILPYFIIISQCTPNLMIDKIFQIILNATYRSDNEYTSLHNHTFKVQKALAMAAKLNTVYTNTPIGMVGNAKTYVPFKEYDVLLNHFNSNSTASTTPNLYSENNPYNTLHTIHLGILTDRSHLHPHIVLVEKLELIYQDPKTNVHFLCGAYKYNVNFKAEKTFEQFVNVVCTPDGIVFANYNNKKNGMFALAEAYLKNANNLTLITPMTLGEKTSTDTRNKHSIYIKQFALNNKDTMIAFSLTPAALGPNSQPFAVEDEYNFKYGHDYLINVNLQHITVTCRNKDRVQLFAKNTKAPSVIQSPLNVIEIEQAPHHNDTLISANLAPTETVTYDYV